MVIEWRPRNDFETRLGEAFFSDNNADSYALLRNSEFTLPITEAAHSGSEPPQWATFTNEERTWIIAFTSMELMEHASGGAVKHARVVTLQDIAAGWPDPAWGLAINPRYEVSFYFESGVIGRLAAPPLALYAAADSEFRPVMQKVLPPGDVDAMLQGGDATISGYVQFAWDTSHIATPTVLVDTLGLTPPERYVDANGSVFSVRWHAYGLDLYEVPFGGTTPENRDLVAGTVVEEAPFFGLGYAPNPDSAVREFKVAQVALPMGAEIWELGFDGEDRRRAIYDADNGIWRHVARRSEVEEPIETRESAGPPPPPRMQVQQRIETNYDKQYGTDR